MSNVIRLRYSADADASAPDGASRAVAFAVLAFVAGLLALFVAVAANHDAADPSADTIALTMYGP
jgi:hypothetical protein